MLTDSLSAGATTAAGAGRPGLGGGNDEEQASQRLANYGDAQFMDEQPRLIDLVPRRLSAYLLLLLAGLAVIAALEGLYTWMPRFASLTTDGRVATFDLDGEGSLAVWFSSMTLALAGLTAILVYSIRRHKTDDYRGHYRIWLWAATCWFVMSIDETASLHEGFKGMMIVVTGTEVFGDGSIWWAAVYFFLLGAVGTRLLVDMRRCWLSSGALLLVAVCYAVAVATQHGWILPDYGARAVMLEEGAEMLGDVVLLLAMGLHARYVILDAKGLLRQRRRWWGGRRAGALEENEGTARSFTAGGSLTVHPPHGVSRPAAPAAAPSVSQPALSATAGVGASQSSTATGDSGPADWPVQRKLTKAERKALRKRLAKMKADRQRRQRGG
jgi:hypothetical protein